MKTCLRFVSTPTSDFGNTLHINENKCVCVFQVAQQVKREELKRLHRAQVIHRLLPD